MDGSESERAPQTEPTADDASKAQAEAEAEAASGGLRGQIAALRKQVKEAQETLRDQERRRDEGRSFKR
jgi:hypothetical protein